MVKYNVMCFAVTWLRTSDITKIEKSNTLTEGIIKTMKGEEQLFF